MHSFYRFTRMAAGSMVLASALAAQGVKPVTPPAAAKAASTTDPRVGLKAGLYDAASSIKGLKLVSTTPKSAKLDGEGGARGLTFANSDLAFKAPYVYQGNFSGFQVWNMSNPSKPTLTAVEVCGALLPQRLESEISSTLSTGGRFIFRNCSIRLAGGRECLTSSHFVPTSSQTNCHPLNRLRPSFPSLRGDEDEVRVVSVNE